MIIKGICIGWLALLRHLLIHQTLNTTRDEGEGDKIKEERPLLTFTYCFNTQVYKPVVTI